MALTDDIRSHYRCEEGTGAAILDAFSSYDLAVTGTVSSTTGKVGNARTFLASASSRGDAGARSSVTAIPATLTCWFRLNSTGVAHALMSCCTAAANTLIILGVNSSNQLVGYGESAGVGSVPLAGSTTLTTGTWYHAAFVAESGAFKIYLDGSVEDTDTTSLSISGFDRQYLAARFYGGGLGEYADADIDEATFFARALDAADISTLRAGGAGLAFSAWTDWLADAAPSVAWCYPLDEASGSRADSVGGLTLTDGNTVGSGTGNLYALAADYERDNSEYLSRASAAALQSGAGKFMLRAWVKLESKTDNMTVVGKFNGSDWEYGLEYRSGPDRFRFTVYSAAGFSGGVSVESNNFGSPSTGTWYLLHALHDPDGDVIGLGVNGGAMDYAAHSTGIYQGTTTFWISDNQFNGWFDGLIQDALGMKDGFLPGVARELDYNGGPGVAFADWAAAPAAAVPAFVASYRRRRAG